MFEFGGGGIAEHATGTGFDQQPLGQADLADGKGLGGIGQLALGKGGAFAQAPADGYTLLAYGSPMWIAPLLRKDLKYDAIKDFAPITLAVTTPNVLVVNAALPVTNVADLVKLAKGKPGQLNYATSGAGSTQHIAAELFKEATQTFITHIPYRGSGPALIDLIGGQVQISFDTMPSVMGQRNMRLLAIRTDSLGDTERWAYAAAPWRRFFSVTAIAASRRPGTRASSALACSACADRSSSGSERW